MTARSRNATPKGVSEVPKSEALKNFEGNLDEIMSFIKRLSTRDVHRRITRQGKIIQEAIAAAPTIDVKRLTRAGEKIQASFKAYTNFLLPACRWMTVMLVSFMEIYLEDGLIEVAKKNPALVKVDRVGTDLIFEFDTMDELKAEIRRKWAHDALRPDRPKKWYRTVRDLGARPLDDKIVRAVQHMWDTRNLIVHARCIADASYVKKYAHYGAKRGQTVAINLSTFASWLEPVKGFVEWADVVFLNYGNRRRCRWFI
jgi:hypothetical protein